MRAIKNNFHGVSEIIGALMLTLIVVGAATSFALFVSQRQEMQQKAEFAKIQRELENIDILNIEPSYDISGLYALNFSIVNVNKDSVRVTGIWINKYPYYHKNENITIIRGNGCKQNWSFDDTNQLRGWTENCSDKWENLTEKYNRHVRLDLEAYETVTFIFNDTSDQIYFFKASQNEPLTIKIYTSRGNIFEKTFYPPTSIIRISTEPQWNATSTNYEDFYILDGSLSDHPGDGYIVKWKWTTSAAPSTPEYGRKIRSDPSITWVNLAVTDNYGMEGIYNLTLT